MAKSKKTKKIKKVRDIEPKIKKIDHEKKSELESGIHQEDLENFSEFLSSKSKTITPVLEASQQTQEQPTEIPQQRSRETGQEARNIYETARSDYTSSFPESGVPGEEARNQSYISQTSRTSVTPSIKPVRIIQDIPGASPQHSPTGFRNFLGDESPGDERKRKYQSELDRQKGKDKARYAWE